MKIIAMIMAAMLLGSMAWALGDFHRMDGDESAKMPCAFGAEKQLGTINEYRTGESGAKDIMDAMMGGDDGETPLQARIGMMGTMHKMA